jgi:hypothetical protein
MPTESTKVHKVIVTSKRALEAKYGAGFAKIRAALASLAEADAARGLTSRVVHLDNAAEMKKLGATPVKATPSAKQNKVAIDGVCQALVPDYLVILGAPDVVPHQDLANLISGDDDELVPSDLPYASDRPYSRAIKDFIGPTRVVGRLPDIAGGSDPAYLVGLLKTAAGYKSQGASLYHKYLGITADVWRGSTTLSLQSIFHNAKGLKRSPTAGPRWTKAQLASRVHFINCHGAPADSHFYGQQGSDYPIAHEAALLAGKIRTGTVVAAECCYGAELYDPLATAAPLGMGNTYLGNKAYAFLGSTTIAYGPADSNGLADLLTQFFLINLLRGASTGRALLQARQDFLLRSGALDPFELKTLAQFHLLGDPAIHPVKSAAAAGSVAVSKSLRDLPAIVATRVGFLGARRENLAKNGLAISQFASYAQADPKKKTPDAIKSLLRDALGETSGVEFSAFPVQNPARNLAEEVKSVRGLLAPAATIHVAVAKSQVRAAPMPQYEVAVAREQGGAVAVQRFASK